MIFLGFISFLNFLLSFFNFLAFFEEKTSEFSKNGIEFKPIQKNLIDGIWEKPKNLPITQLFTHDVKYAGLSIAGKFDLFINKTQEFNDKIGFVLLTELDEIACIFLEK